MHSLCSITSRLATISTFEPFYPRLAQPCPSPPRWRVIRHYAAYATRNASANHHLFTQCDLTSDLAFISGSVDPKCSDPGALDRPYQFDKIERVEVERKKNRIVTFTEALFIPKRCAPSKQPKNDTRFRCLSKKSATGGIGEQLGIGERNFPPEPYVGSTDPR